MTLREYKDLIDKFVIANPNALDYEVIYSKDDEGNGFYPVNYGPDLGKWEGYGESFTIDVLDAEEGSTDAVCIN